MKRPSLLVLLLLALPAGARDRYVDGVNGNDNNDGSTLEKAWKTIPYSMGRLAAGDHLYIKGGASDTDAAAIYTVIGGHGMPVTVTGTAADPIIISPYGTDTVIIQGNNNPSYDGIYTTGSIDYVEFHNLRFRYFWLGVRWTARAADHILIDGCEIDHNANRGMWILNTNHFTMRDSTVHHNKEIGLYVQSCSDVLLERIESSYNDDGFGPDGDADGFATGFVENLRIVDCIAHDNGEDGFDMNANGVMVNCKSYNHGSCGMKLLLRPQDNYALKKMSVINSIIYGNSGSGIACGIRAELHLYNSVIYDNAEIGIFFGQTVGSNVEGTNPVYSTLINNVIASNGFEAPTYSSIYVFTPVTNVVDADHNLYWHNANPSVGLHSDASPITQDPLFLSPDTGLFQLRAGSPAIDRGTVIAGYHNSNPGDSAGDGKAWYGSAPDIGAYEVVLSAITDLSVGGTSQNSLTLAWTAPGGATYRQPTQYDIRYADSPITESTWAAATPVEGEPVPGASEAPQSFTITGVTPGSTYYVAVKTSDERGNISPLSNVVPGTAATTGNHAPVLGPISDRWVYETQSLTIDVNATDADGADTLTYSVAGLPTYANFDAATRTFTWTTRQGQRGTYYVTFQVTDSYVVVSRTVAIEVRATANHAPVIGAVGNQAVNENAPLTFPVSATDEDGDTLTYSVTGLPSGASLANGTFAWTPRYDQAGSYPVTFTVSDGELTDSEQITITVAHVSDRTPPSAQAVYPAASAVQIPLNPPIVLTIADAGSGVQASTVTILVNDHPVYTGDTTLYESAYGTCRRTGTSAGYRYYYYPASTFDFDQDVTVVANASDAANNAMTPLSYQFTTQMRSFGQNQAVSAEGETSGHPVVAADSQGNFWAAWHTGQVGTRNICVAKRTRQGQQWNAPVRLTSVASDRCNPALAIGPDDVLYLAWQDNRRGNWDIYVSVSANGSTWGDPIRVTDSNDSQTNPVIAVDHASPYHVYLAWERGNVGDRDIYLATCSSSFASRTIAQVTSDTADQAEPALAVGSDNNVYLLWTDRRNGATDVDIYGSSSLEESWYNRGIVRGAGNQSHPALAVAPGTSVLHIVWQSDAAGNLDVLYATSSGWPGSALTGSSLIDDTSGADQFAPSIVAARDYASNVHVYAGWQDNRVVGTTQDSDMYFAEIRSGMGGTNVLVGDDGTNSNQSEPALGSDEYGQPALVWVDSRGSTPRIYSASSMYFKPVPVASGLITRAAGGRVGTDPAAIDDTSDVSIQIPANAYDCDVTVTISELRNLPRFTSAGLVGYEIGPSGIQFSPPATVTIPYTSSGSGQGTPYWYDPQTGTLSQQGITEITNRTLGNGIPLVSFKTSHLTTFVLLDTPVANGGGGGGGGCALSSSREGNLFEFMLPFTVLVPYLYLWKGRVRQQKNVSKDMYSS